jgi:hypothetical protein
MNEVICTDTPGTAETADPAGFEKAVNNARALAKALGNGWTGRVWENLGWHYEAKSPCRRIEVYTCIIDGKPDSYGAMLHEPGGNGMPTYLGEPGRGKTPHKALASVVRNAKQRVATIQAIVEGL